MIMFTEQEWRGRIERHTARLRPMVQPHLDRAARHESHPVIDFLFQYYPFAPSRLLRWSPGFGVGLSGDIPPDFAMIKEGRSIDGVWRLDSEMFPVRRREPLAWMRNLLQAVEERPPRFGCFGLHEWAMVYRSDTIRHGQLPLRFSPEETAAVVESMPVACSHYDAFRFFTPAARPLNRIQPALDKRMDLEQRGCLHANMDLYKWSSMFYPWISSDLIADCFLLALRIREVDMRASPYDLRSMHLEPICIETEEGRQAYVALQAGFAEEARPLRRRLMGEADALLAALPA